MPLAPFLHFQGSCAEALAFYARVFDAPEPSIMRYSEAPGDVPAAGGDRVMYGTVDTGEGLLMAPTAPARSGWHASEARRSRACDGGHFCSLCPVDT
jgi:PhnB protein